MNPHWQASRRLRYATVHAAGCLLVAALAAALVFGLWFRPPFHVIAGGLAIFGILVSVDVVVGPLLTAVAAAPGKPEKVLWRDLAVIVALQLAALAYGIHVLAVARPVVMAFEVDRMRLLTVAEIDETLLPKAPEALRELSWTGPRLVAAERPRTRQEMLQAIDLAIGGLDISNLPSNWRPYETQEVSAWNAARPLPELDKRYPLVHDELVGMARGSGAKLEDLRFLPLVSRSGAGSVVLAPNDRVVGVVPVDGFL